jgi:hypothetical protein
MKKTIGSHKQAGSFLVAARPFALLVLLLPGGWLSTKAAAITINEIHYGPKPTGPKGPNLEFLELFNEASEVVDLSNFSFTRGITYTFPYPTFVKGNGYIVVAADPAALLAANPLLQSDNPKFPKVVGPYSGKLDDSGETITIVNPGGALQAEVKYNNRGAWPAEAEKTGHSLILKDPFLDPSLPKNWGRSPFLGGSPGIANLGERIFVDTALVRDGENWKYLKGLKLQETDPDPPSVPADAWRNAGFNDAAWLEGPAPIGFDTPANPEFKTVLDDMLDKYLTVFFRKEFDVPSKEGMDQLVLKLGYDDGFVAYLNGIEVARKNVRAGQETYLDRASATTETKLGDAREEFDLTGFVKDTLKEGKNILAVQVHNAIISSNDCGFAPSLLYRTEKTLGGGFTEVPVKVNELSSSNPSDRWLELYNESDTPIPLSGFYLTNDPTELGKYKIPDGKVIGPRGWLVFTQTELAPSGVNLFIQGNAKSVWIGLSTPGLDQVVDAYAFKPPQGPDLSEARYPDGDRNWVLSRQPTKGAQNQFLVERDVVINEIMYHPFYPNSDFPEPGSIFRLAEDQGEYIELYNRSQRSIPLGGWSLTEGIDFSFPNDAVLGPGGYLVVAKDPEWLANHYGLDRAKILGPFYKLHKNSDGVEVPDMSDGTLSNEGEKIELHDELGNVANSVRYADSGLWPVWADSRGSSLELIDPNQDNSEAAAWDASDDSSKAEWQHYSYKGRSVGQAELKFMLLTTGIVILDNISITDPANPAVANYIPYGDFEAPLKPTDILFGGTHAWSSRITSGAKDGTGALRIVSTGRGNNRADRVEINTFSPALPGSKELQIDFDAKWVCGEGVLLTAGYNHTMAQSHFIKVPERLGTPGSENSVHKRLADGNLGPIISGVRHAPVIPGPQAPVNIRAKVTDSDGVASVRIEWRLDGTPEASIASVSMLDDGQNGDGAPGDDVYGGQIPGQDLNKIVVFRVVATDRTGHSSRFPFEESQRTHGLRVDPSNLAPTGARTNPPARNIVYQHASYAPDPVRSYRMIFSKENWTYLSGRPIMSNDLVDGTFVFNNREAYYSVGMRFGNSPWTRGSYGPTNASYRVKFGKDETFHGWRKFKLDNQRNENYMDERVTMYLWNANASAIPGASPPSLDHLYCQPYVSFNGSQQKLIHIFDQVEVPAKLFLDKWWPEDSNGVLYKVDDRFEVDDSGNRLTNEDAHVLYPPNSIGGDKKGDNKEGYRWFFMHRTRDKYDSFSELMELAKILDTRTTNAADFNAKLFDGVNVEQLARNWALSINLDDWDTWGTTRGKNCYLYRPRADGRWTLIPWDKDLVFGNLTQLAVVPGNFPEVARVLNSANGKRVYFNILRDMLDSFYTAGFVNTFFSEVAKVAPAGAIGSYSRGASFVSSRANTIRQALGTQTVPFEITSPVGDQVTQAETSVVVKGTAAYGVWMIAAVINGNKPVLLQIEDGGISWATTRWTTRAIELSPGVNQLTFLALGADGEEELGRDSITITVSNSEPQFVRGDSDRNGEVNLTDAVVVLNHLFKGVPVASCLDTLDSDDSGFIDLTDAIYLLRFLFQGELPPPAPFPAAGPDPTEDTLTPCS